MAKDQGSMQVLRLLRPGTGQVATYLVTCDERRRWWCCEVARDVLSQLPWAGPYDSYETAIMHCDSNRNQERRR